MSETALSLQKITYAYPDATPAIDQLSLAVQNGRALGIIGPNGAGKTTLFGLASGLLLPNAGTVAIYGRQHGPDNRTQRDIGYVFQETDDQLFSPTVFEDVAFGPANFGLPPAELRENVSAALARVNLIGYEDRVPHHLSSGEKRRVAIAGVLSYGPRLLLLDEPTSDLDPRGKIDLSRLLVGMNDTTRVIASHDLEFILMTCDDVVLLEAGKLCASGPVANILSNEKLLEQHGLNPPLGLSGKSAEELNELKLKALSKS